MNAGSLFSNRICYFESPNYVTFSNLMSKFSLILPFDMKTIVCVMLYMFWTFGLLRQS